MHVLRQMPRFLLLKLFKLAPHKKEMHFLGGINREYYTSGHFI